MTHVSAETVDWEPHHNEAMTWLRLAYRDPRDPARLDDLRFTRWNMVEAYAAGKGAATAALTAERDSALAEVGRLRTVVEKLADARLSQDSNQAQLQFIWLKDLARDALQEKV